LKFGYLGDDCEHRITVTGPDVVVPPGMEMSDAELSKWEFDLTCGTGYSLGWEKTPLDAPLVEARKTFEDEIPKGTVKTELFWARTNDDQEMLACRVISGWHMPIPKFSLTADYRFDVPQPTAGIAKGRYAGGSDSFCLPRDSVYGEDLYPRVTVEYYLPPMAISGLKSRAASMSPETHWIALRTADQEFDRISGGSVAEFLEQEI
jgi:hypothetical protein